jgi:hypothetical protein
MYCTGFAIRSSHQAGAPPAAAARPPDYRGRGPLRNWDIGAIRAASSTDVDSGKRVQKFRPADRADIEGWRRVAQYDARSIR